MITLSTKSKGFSFNVAQDKFSNALSLISSQSLADAVYILCAADSKLWLCSVSSSFVGALQVEAEVKGEGNFAFDLKMIQGVVKGRNSFAFNYTGSELEFKAAKSKYEGKVVTLPVTKEQASTFNEIISEKAKGIKLSEEVLSEISNAVRLTSIKNVATKEQIVSLVRLKNNKLSVSCFDDYHIVLYKTPLESEDIQFSVNPQTLLSIEKAIGGKFELSVKPENLRFSNKNLIFVIPTAQADDQKYDIPIDFLKNLDKPKFSAVVDSGAFLSVCDNLDAIHTVNSQFDFSLKESSLQIQFKTEQGSAADRIKVGENFGKGKCSVDPKAFIELLNLHKSTCNETTITGHNSVAGLYSKKKKVTLQSVTVLTSSSNKQDKE